MLSMVVWYAVLGSGCAVYGSGVCCLGLFGGGIALHCMESP